MKSLWLRVGKFTLAYTSQLYYNLYMRMKLYLRMYLKVYMHKDLINAGVNFPDYWDEVRVLNALTTLDTYAQYEYFGCANSTSFTRLMKPCFPNRPSKMSYSAYVRGLVCADVSEIVCESVSDPKLEEQDKFMELYKKGPVFNKKLVAALPEDSQERYSIFSRNMSVASEYN